MSTPKRIPAPPTAFLALLGLLALLLPISVAAADQPDAPTAWSGGAVFPGDERPRFDGLPPNAEVLRLENGLEVLLLRNPSQDMVSVVTQVKVGSAHEDFRTSGMSHMLEHLLFNGSDRWSQERQYALADSIGAWNNAHTSEFFTNFIMLVPEDALALGVELQAEMLFHSTLPAEKFEKERGIVVGEIAQARDRGGDEAAAAIRDAVFHGSDLALPVLGTLSTIEAMAREDVLAFYRNYYVPNNMVTTVAGGFDRAEVLALLREHYGAVPPGTVARPESRPAPYIDRTRIVSRRAGETEIVALAFEAPTYGSPDVFPFMVLADLLDAPATGILTRAVDALPPDERPAVSVWWERSDGYGRLVVELEVPEAGDPAEAYDLVHEALTRAAQRGVAAEDVLEVVRMRETGTLIEREQLRHLAIVSAAPIAQGGIDFFLDVLPRLTAVEAETVGRVLAAYLVDSPHLVVHVEPRGDASASEAADAVVLERSELANGAVLLTLENPGSPLFAAHLTARNRAEIDGDKPGTVNLVHRLLRHGVGGCDEECTARRLRLLGAELKLVDDPRFPMDDYYTHGRFSWIRLEAAAANGPEALVQVLDLIQHAGFTADDFAAEQQAQLALLQRRRGSARARADALLARGLYGDHPLARPAEGTVASVGAVSYDDVRRAFRRAFSPDNLVVAVVSPLPHARVASLISEQVSGRAAPGPGMAPPQPVTSEVRLTETVDGPMAAVRMGSLVRVAEEDAPALGLLVSVLSDRLQQDLRETRGLSYSVGAGVAVRDGVAELEAWLNPPAPRLTEGEAALAEALRDFDPATVTVGELEAARNARRGRMMMRRLSSIAQAYYLSLAELEGEPGRYLDPFSRLDAVTTSDLVRVGARYLQGRPWVTVVVD